MAKHFNGELYCKIHGSKGGSSIKDAVLDATDLEKSFKLTSERSIQDELARQRAVTCKEALVARGVSDEQLLVTWAGFGKLSKVDLFMMKPVEALAAKAAWDAKTAEAVNMFQHNVNGPWLTEGKEDYEHRVDRLSAKTYD